MALYVIFIHNHNNLLHGLWYLVPAKDEVTTFYWKINYSPSQVLFVLQKITFYYIQLPHSLWKESR